MVRLDLDAVIVYGTPCTYENIRYLTGHWPMFERGGVCVPRKGEAILLIGAEAPGLARESVLGDSFRMMKEFGHTFEITWHGVEFTTFEELFDQISIGKGVRRVGLTDYPVTPAETYENIHRALLPGGEIISIADVMVNMRKHKTPAEISLIREANKINEKVFEDFLGQVTPDMTEYQCQGLILAGIYKHGGEAESFPTLLYSGERTLNQIGRGTHTQIGRNRLVDCDFGAMLGTYSSAYCRPFMFGKMSDQLKKEIRFMVDVHKKVIHEWVRPGVRMEEVQGKFIQAFLDNGFGYPPAGASHGIGIFECEPPLMSSGGMIEEDMVFAADHFFKGNKYGFRIEDCYCVTATGTELFTDRFWDPIEL